MNEAEKPIRKVEFARRRNVTPSRVSQWISEGKISAAALVGTGRAARIMESVAVSDLRERLDVTQLFGANGITTRLGDFARPSERPAPNLGSHIEPIDDQLRREKLEQLQRANRRDATQEALEAGTLVMAEDAKRELAQVTQRMAAIFEGAFVPGAAQAMAAKYGLPIRDVTHEMQKIFRGLRLAEATKLKVEAAAMSSTVERTIEPQSACEVENTSNGKEHPHG